MLKYGVNFRNDPESKYYVILITGGRDKNRLSTEAALFSQFVLKILY